MKLRLAGLVLACALGLAAPAFATIVRVTLDGTIVHGVDESGVFGAPGASLVGDAYSVNLNYFYPQGTETDTGSGEKIAVPKLIYGSSLTIAGATYAFPTTMLGEIDNVYADHYDQFLVNLPSSTQPSADPAQPSALLTLPVRRSIFHQESGACPTGPVACDFHVSIPGLTQPYTAANGWGPNVVEGNGATYQLFVANLPEPGTWALMTAGLGLAGAALRRRRGLRPQA